MSKGVRAAAALGTMSRCPSLRCLFPQGQDPGHSHPGAFLARGFPKVFLSQKPPPWLLTVNPGGRSCIPGAFPGVIPEPGLWDVQNSTRSDPNPSREKDLSPEKLCWIPVICYFLGILGGTSLGSHGNIPRFVPMPLTLWALGGASRAVALRVWL